MPVLTRKMGCVLSILVLLSASNSYAASALTVDGATTIDSTTAKEMWDEGVKFIDVRQGRYDEGHIPGAVWLSIAGSFNEETLSKVVAKNERFVIYDQTENYHHAAVATKKAVSWGYTNVYYYRFGLAVWIFSGFPIE